VSNRADAAIQKVAPEDLVQLAEQIHAVKEQLWMHRCKNLIPVLEGLKGQVDA
jgi:hypothetical protein